MSAPLSETNPGLVKAAKTALDNQELNSEDFSKQSTFDYLGQKYWTKIRIDPVSNTIDRWDVFLAEATHLRW